MIVHVLWQRAARHPARGATQLIAYTAGYRYIRVTLDGDAAVDEVVALLGHELQQVAEIAAAPWVIDEHTLETLYLRIGTPSCGRPIPCFETARARATGAQVLREMGPPQPAASEEQ